MVNDLQSCATLNFVKFVSGSFALHHEVPVGAKGRIKVNTSARLEFQKMEGLDRGEKFYLIVDIEYVGLTEQGRDDDENKTFSVQYVVKSEFASNCDNLKDVEKFSEYIPALFERIYPFIRSHIIGIILDMGISAPGIPWNLSLRPEDVRTDESKKHETEPSEV